MEKLILAEKEYLDSKLGIRELSKKYSVNRQVLTGWLMAKGFQIKNRRAEKSFNIEVFNNIDTEEKAYWLGFLFADGSVNRYKNSYTIELSLASKDRLHLEKFAKFIGKEKMYSDDIRSRISIGSKEMFYKLIEHGCTENKSLTLKFPNKNIFEDESLLIHFIRGYFDGDGCVSHSDKEKKRVSVSILGTKDFLSNLNKIAYPEKEMKLHNENNIYILSFNGRTAIKFLSRLYDNSSVYLERKKEKYIEYCRLYKELYR